MLTWPVILLILLSCDTDKLRLVTWQRTCYITEYLSHAYTDTCDNYLPPHIEWKGVEAGLKSINSIWQWEREKELQWKAKTQIPPDYVLLDKWLSKKKCSPWQVRLWDQLSLSTVTSWTRRLYYCRRGAVQVISWNNDNSSWQFFGCANYWVSTNFYFFKGFKIFFAVCSHFIGIYICLL